MTDAEKTLAGLLEKIVKDLGYKDFEIKPITSGGENYTSALFLVKLVDLKRELNLFAKVASMGDKMRQIMNAETVFKTEAFVYIRLKNMYKRLQEINKVPEEELFVFPKFYGCNTDKYKETVVLENLVARGYKTHDRFKSMEWEYASNAVETLAKFHALSFAFRKHDPREFERISEEFLFKTSTPNEEFVEVWKKMIAKGLGVLKEEHRPRIVKYLEDGGEHLFQKYNVPTGTPVLIHGDYRTSNLLYKHLGDKLQVIPVDYQTVRSGCPATDLVYFIFTGSDARFRAEHYERLVEHYFQQLTCALERLGLDPAEEYPREQFDSDMKQMLPYAIFLGLAVLPIVTVQAEEAPRVDGDADLAGFVLDANELYTERFGGIVEDFVRWGII